MVRSTIRENDIMLSQEVREMSREKFKVTTCKVTDNRVITTEKMGV